MRGGWLGGVDGEGPKRRTRDSRDIAYVLCEACVDCTSGPKKAVDRIVAGLRYTETVPKAFVRGRNDRVGEADVTGCLAS